MRVYIDTGLPERDRPHRLFLHPETEQDQETLRRLRDEYRLTNYGSDPDSDRVLHVGIRLTPGDGPDRDTTPENA